MFPQGDPGEATFVIGDTDFDCGTSVIGTCTAVDNLEPGILRITLGGDTVNAGRIESEVTITTTSLDRSGLTASGTVDDGPAIVDLSVFPAQLVAPGNSVTIPVLLPMGSGPLSEVEIRLEWDGDWSRRGGPHCLDSAAAELRWTLRFIVRLPKSVAGSPHRRRSG